MIYNVESIRTMPQSVKRNFTMNHYQQLVNAIDNLIYDKAVRDEDGWYLDFDDLDDDEKGELAALSLEYFDRDTSECFNDPAEYAKDDNVTCALLNMLCKNDMDSKEDLAEAVRKQTIKSFSTFLKDKIDDRCGWCRKDHMDNKGYDE